MFTSLTKLWNTLIDFILPPRSDFEVVKKLDEETIYKLPKPNNLERLDWIHPLFNYKDNKVRAIIWELKYKDNTKPLEHIGKILFDEITALISDIVVWNSDAQFLLIPIPISNERRIERGYNQSEYIAKSILPNDLGHTLTYAPQWFRKVKETTEQNKSHTKQERLENLSGCFEARPEVEGKYVILIDDVVTTGSTLLEARKTLLEAGSRDVFAFTIAH
jgi:ComF family protein